MTKETAVPQHASDADGKHPLPPARRPAADSAEEAQHRDVDSEIGDRIQRKDEDDRTDPDVSG